MRRFILDLDFTIANSCILQQGGPSRIKDLDPVPGALKFLQRHAGKCILLTAGIKEDQLLKIKVLDIESYFSEIHIVPKPEDKRQKLQEIVEAIRAKRIYKFSRIDIVVIGDRLDIEMRRGKELKCVTVRIQIPGGLRSGDLPIFPLDHPDFEARNFNDLMRAYPALFA